MKLREHDVYIKSSMDVFGSYFKIKYREWSTNAEHAAKVVVNILLIYDCNQVQSFIIQQQRE